MSTLYELTADYALLLEMATDPDVDPELLADTMAGLEGEIEIKADGYAKVIRQIEANIGGIKEEEKRLARRRKTMENSIKRMKESLQTAMKTTGKTKFKTNLFSFGIKKNPPALVIDKPDQIPAKYLIPQPPAVDNAAIKADLLIDGAKFDFAHTEQGESLQIR